jgi:hypothetical protein
LSDGKRQNLVALIFFNAQSRKQKEIQQFDIVLKWNSRVQFTKKVYENEEDDSCASCQFQDIADQIMEARVAKECKDQLPLPDLVKRLPTQAEVEVPPTGNLVEYLQRAMITWCTPVITLRSRREPTKTNWGESDITTR